MLRRRFFHWQYTSSAVLKPLRRQHLPSSLVAACRHPPTYASFGAQEGRRIGRVTVFAQPRKLVLTQYLPFIAVYISNDVNVDWSYLL